jgi:hypothetical protein
MARPMDYQWQVMALIIIGMAFAITAILIV